MRYEQEAKAVIDARTDEERHEAGLQLFGGVVNEEGKILDGFVERYTVFYCVIKQESFEQKYNEAVVDLITKQASKYLADQDIQDCSMAQDVVKAIQHNLFKDMPDDFSPSVVVRVHNDLCAHLGVPEDSYDINYKQFGISKPRNDALANLIAEVFKDVSGNAERKEYSKVWFPPEEYKAINFHDYMNARVPGWDEQIEKDKLERLVKTDKEATRRQKI